MKQLLYLVISLIIIAAIIPNVSAAYERYYPNNIPTSVLDRNTSYTMTSQYTSDAQVDTLCLPGTRAQWGISTYSGTLTFFNASPTPPTAFFLSGGTAADYNKATSRTFTSGYYHSGIQVVNNWYSCFEAGHAGDVNYADEYNTQIWIIPDVNVTNQNIPNFTGTPLSGAAPVSTTFTIQNQTSINGPVSWIFGDGNTTLSSASSILHVYPNQGMYSVSMIYTNWSGFSNTITKLNYVNASASNATKTKFFQTIDGTNGNIVLNSSIQLNDIENSSWINATGLINDGMSSITTLEGHHINAYAQALGYSDADDLNLINDGLPRSIMMWPTFAKNVSAGNVSVYVTVKDKDTKANIVGAQVTISTQAMSVSTTTNDAGIAYFIVNNNTMCLVTASAQGLGYLAATTTINTGSANGGSAAAAATILLGKSTTVIPTYTVPTTLPGGGTPVPTVTILPGCEDTISAAGQEKCRAAQSNQGLSFLSGNLLGLIQICFVVTILYLLGIKLGK